MDVLAEEGISDTSVSRIIARAGVSRGMIHLHFGGKDALMGAAAEQFAHQYYDEMERQLSLADGSPEGTILAIIQADLGDGLMNKRSVAIWHALRGAAHSNPTVEKFSDTRDQKLRTLISDCFAAFETDLVGDARDALVKDATLGLLALLEGMWTDFMVHPDSFDRNDALRIVCRFLNGLFPGTLNGDA